MRMRLLRLLTLASVAPLLTPHASFSQTAPGAEQTSRLEITPYLGYGADMTSMMGSWNGDFAGPHAGTGPTFGGRVAIRLTGNVFVETSTGYSGSGHMFDGRGDRSGHMAVIDRAELSTAGDGSRTLSYEGNVSYEFPSSRWVPYLTGGVGAFTTWPDSGSGWTEAAANVGVGLKFYPQPRVGLRLDVREYVGRFRRAGELSAGSTDARQFGGHPQITAGVVFGL